MRFFVLALGLLLAGCATTAKDEPIAPSIGLSAKTLAAGDCGLYVWTADTAKTFTLFATSTGVTYLKGDKEISLTEKNPTTPPASSREFMDEIGGVISLTLLSPQQIKDGTRYKSGRLISLDDEGWEIVVPVVGFYGCQPLI